MKNLVFAGCSFTHAPDSWAHCSNPWVYDDDKLKYEIEKLNNCFTRTEFSSVNQSHAHVDKVYQDLLEVYSAEDIKEFDPSIIWRNVRKLSKDRFRINILGSGANSNVDIARSVIHFIENSGENIDSIIFQITAFDRSNLFFYPKTETIDNFFRFTQYDDIYFQKNREYEVEGVNNTVCAIEALQNLTTFCQSKNIKITYFHGWDNYSETDTFEYVRKKYNLYVKPYLLTDTNIIDHASKMLKPHCVLQHNDLHPSTLAHKKFWNDIVYPFIKNLDK